MIFSAVFSFLLFGGTITSEQSAEAPDGFYYSMKATVTSADATPTGVNSISYWVEGYDAQHLGFGTASAQTCTISFWVKSSIVGTYSVAIQDNDYAVSYVAEYSISSPNTWEQKTVTFAGPTTGSWGKTSAASGVRIWWDIGSGDSDTVSTVNQWTGRGFRSTSSVRLIETSGATFQITGVQLELGSVATDFEHRSYGEELALCQRYYQYHGNNNQMLIGWSYCGTNEHCWGSFQFPKMRVAPTATYTGTAHSNCAGDITVSGIATTPSSLEYMNTAPTSLPAGYFVSVPNLWLDAEL